MRPSKHARIEVVGVRQLMAALDEFPESLKKKTLRPIFRKIGKEIVLPAAARNLGTSGKRWRKTQPLKDSLVVRAARRSRRQFGVSVRTKDGARSPFSGDHFYAGFLEFGTKNRRTKRRGIVRRGAFRGRIGKASSGYKFLRRAIYENESAIRQRFTQILKDAVPAAARAISGKAS